MSQENVDRVRRGFEAAAPGNFDEFLGILDPDVVYKPVQEAPMQGRDAVRSSLERWEADWDWVEMTSEEVIDVGDRVMQTILFRGRGRGSGVEVDGRFFQVYTFKDGKVVHWEEFSDRAEALEAAGPSEQDARAEPS